MTARLLGQIALPAVGTAGQVITSNGTAWVAADAAAGSGTVKKVNGIDPDGSGAVTVPKSAIGLGSVDNTSDASKPISTAAQAALDLKAPLVSPALTGTPTVPTAAPGTNSSQAANTAFVKAAVDALVAGAPGALDTLNEIATQLSADESAVSALTTTVAGKVPATRTVNGKALSADISLTASDVGAATDSAVVHQTDQLKYVRRYSSGVWPVRGTVPSGSSVEWLGPSAPPIDGTYALAGVDTYTVTVS